MRASLRFVAILLTAVSSAQAVDSDGATCPQCNEVLEGSTSLIAGATSAEECDCTPGYYLKANATSSM